MTAVATRPRIGFLGLGWIGRNRLEALERSGVAEIGAVADPALPEALDRLDEVDAAFAAASTRPRGFLKAVVCP